MKSSHDLLGTVKAKAPPIGHNSGKAIESFTLVPASYIGKAADGTKAAIPALHLIAYKCRQGGAFVLNVADVAFRLRMLRRKFWAGLRHLDSTGVMTRGQPNRRAFAIEKLAPPGQCYRVQIADRVILESSSSAVAFTLAANVSPTPRKPCEIAARIGIASPKTTRNVMAECIAADAIEIFPDAQGALWVCRPGEVPEGVGKIGTAKIGTAKIGTAQRIGKEVQRTGEKNKKIENTYIPATAGPCDFEVLNLIDWRNNPKVLDLARDGDPIGYFAPPNGETLTATELVKLVAHFGENCPHHLRTKNALDQIEGLAAACMSLAESTDNLKFADAVLGIASQIAAAVKSGQVIRSLAFIALPILTASFNGNVDWANEHQSPVLAENQAAYFDWARHMHATLNGRGIAVSFELLTTRRIEELHALLQRYGQAVVDRAIATSDGPATGDQICGWLWFEPQCRAIAAERIADPLNSRASKTKRASQ